jgi:hypothetical protein
VKLPKSNGPGIRPELQGILKSQRDGAMKFVFAPSQKSRSRKPPARRKWQSGTGGSHELVPISTVLVNWAALVALWALPHLTLLDHFRLEMAQSEALQWLLVAIGASGVASILFTAWRQTRDPAWRASHGLSARGR